MAEACRDRRRGVWWGVGGLARGGKGGGVEVLRGAHPARAAGRATSPLGVTPCLEARTSRPLSAPAAFYAVAWPLPGASMPQGRHSLCCCHGRVL